jgi:Peptidase A4 family
MVNKLFAAGIITIALPWGGMFSHRIGAGQQSVIVERSGGGQASATQTSGAQGGEAPPALNVPAAANTSYNWAGYVATARAPAAIGQTAKQFTSVSGTWTIPTVAPATSTQADTTWVGIGGVTSQDLIQAGTQAIAQPNGSVTYAAWYETLPQTTMPLNVTVNPGDSVSASVTEVSSGEWLIAFRNNTTGASTSEQVAYNSSLSAAEWIEEMPLNGNSFVPLDDFGAIAFLNGTAVENGDTVTISGAGAEPLTMVTDVGQTLAAPSALGTDGESFSVSRTSVSAAPTGGFRVTIPNGRTWRRRVTGIEGYAPGTTTTTQPATGNTGNGDGYGETPFSIPGVSVSINGSDPFNNQIFQMLQALNQELQYTEETLPRYGKIW